MSVKFFKNYNLDTPSWQSCLDNFNQSLLQNKKIKHDNFGFYVSHDAHQISEVAKVLDNLNLSIAHLYFSICSGDNGFGRHQDNDDVFFWQVQGITIWVIEDIKYVLEPGDLIFVPAQTPHLVLSHTPRMGISMSK